jgi:hypothetical protein
VFPLAGIIFVFVYAPTPGVFGWTVVFVFLFRWLNDLFLWHISRWNLDRLARVGREEDVALAERGLAQWSDALDTEDRS